jgi:hypothetical protein
MSTTSSVENNELGTQTTHLNANESAQKTWGAGPIAVLHVRSYLLGHVALTAEINVTASYQWISEFDASASSAVNSPPASSVYASGSSSHTKGWEISMSSVRIGFIVNL